jgi:hypothetical protein
LLGRHIIGFQRPGDETPHYIGGAEEAEDRFLCRGAEGRLLPNLKLECARLIAHDSKV